MKQYTHPIYQKEIDAFSNYLRLKRYSNINTYTGYMGILLKFIYALDCHLDDITKAGFEYYLLNNNWSQSHQRQVHGCLGNFFREILKRNDVVDFVEDSNATIRDKIIEVVKSRGKFIRANDLYKAVLDTDNPTVNQKNSIIPKEVQHRTK